MSQQLTIHNFGSIKELQFNLKNLLIFIGSKASDKNTINKAIFFFKSLRDDLINYIWQCYLKKQFEESTISFENQVKQKFIKIFGSDCIYSQMELKYNYGNGLEIIVNSSKDTQSIDIIFNEYFENKYFELIEKFKNIITEEETNFNILFPSSYQLSIIKDQLKVKEYIINKINNLFNDDKDLIYLPSYSNLISFLFKQYYNIDLIDDYIMQQFINHIYKLNLIFSKPINIKDNNENKKQIRLAQNIINSIFESERINFKDDYSILLKLASEQSAIWIVLSILLFIINQNKIFLIIEEPEAGLFPTAQNQLINLIALLLNQNDNQIILTTNSPYILSSFNNLLYAYQLSLEKFALEEIKSVVNHNFWIHYYMFNAFMINEGTAYSIMDPEMGIINSAEIDKASEIIVNTFNKLFEIED